MVFCKDVSSWLDVVDDAGILVRRLEIVENLLRKCVSDMPGSSCRFMDDTPEGYDGSEMLPFLDESLMDLLEDYKVQINKYEGMLRKSQAGFAVNMVSDEKASMINAFQPDKAA